MRTAATVLALISLLGGSANLALADVFNMPSGQKSLELVTVGDAGNAANTLGYGRVDYTYQMGKYDVTAAQYSAFLNAIASASDPYGLYNTSMGPGTTYGCGIIQSGGPGNYSYSVAPGRENFPVNFVSWGDAARFANWLTSNQPAGVQDVTTTEDGSYALNGATSHQALTLVARKANARYVIPSENEWIKAAYYKGGSKNAGYWLYPTRSDAPPSNVLSGTGTNNANWYSGTYTDPVNYLTPVGAFGGSPGPYGTFDMGGDLWQWNEATTGTMYRGMRGASFSTDVSYMSYGAFGGAAAGLRSNNRGFRVVRVPEPTTLSLLALGGLFLARRRRG